MRCASDPRARSVFSFALTDSTSPVSRMPVKIYGNKV
jgi:hypothetical protein